MASIRWFTLVLLGQPLLAQVVQQPAEVFFGDDPGDGFGTTLAVAGDVDADGVPDWIVGMPDDDNGADDAGSARVFSGADGSVLYTFDGLAALDDLGIAVAGAGDVDGDGHADLIVGAWQSEADNPAGGYFGAGYAQVFSGATGAMLHTFTGSTELDRYGVSVAGVGDLDGDGLSDLAVGASYFGSHDGAIGPGRLYLYSGADGSLLFTIDGDDDYDELGSAVAGTGDLTGDGVPDLLVGADGDRDNWPDNGFGSVTLRSGADGSVVFKWWSTGGYEDFGNRVAVVGDVDGDGSVDLAGAGRTEVRIWSGADGSLLHLVHGQGWQGYGSELSVAGGGDLDGDGRVDFVVGDPMATQWGALGGLVSVYSGADGSLVQRLLGTQTGHLFGTGVAIPGDLDGDGLADLLASAPGDGAGRVDLTTRFDSPQVFFFAGAVADDGFGRSVGGAGDVDNDGIDDVVAGAPYTTTTKTNVGRVEVRSGRDGSLLHEWFGDWTSGRLGYSVCLVGDADHDGCADVAAGAPYPYGPPALPGRVRLWSGHDGALLHEWAGVSAGDQFGYAVAPVGDVDGDGRADLLVGAPADDLAAANAGAARLFSGTSGALLWQGLGAAASDAFGTTVAGAGDVDGDGVPDLLVGAPTNDAGGSNAGQVLLVSGADGALLHTYTGAVALGGLGRAIAGVGDVDGDGVPDVALAAPYDASVPAEGIGRVFVHSGADGSLLLGLGGDDPADGAVGYSVAAAGDVDADGFADVAVGASDANGNGAASGAVWIFSGASGERLHTFVGPAGGSHMGTALAFAGDVDDDFFPDIVAGAVSVPGLPSGGLWIMSPTFTDEPWSDLGAVLPGAQGSAFLTPSGSLAGGAAGALDVAGALPGAPAHLVLGLSGLLAPFRGGVLVPSPDVVVSGLPVDGAGALHVPFVFPAGVPAATPIWMQVWIPDAGAIQGLAATNGVLGLSP